MNALIDITRQLAARVDELTFAPPVSHVYNPLIYARAPHEAYIKKYAHTGQVLLLGMNPGPFGMAQTGVPFGDVTQVREFLQIEGRVDPPRREHPGRRVQGFLCSRKEVSGSRLWGFAKERFGTPERFFKQFFVVNYCPLVFMGETGRNITPNKLPAGERSALEAICDEALAKTVEALAAPMVIGVGAFAEQVCRRALSSADVWVARVLHPSPASPAANRGWAEQAAAQLDALGVL